MSRLKNVALKPETRQRMSRSQQGLKRSFGDSSRFVGVSKGEDAKSWKAYIEVEGRVVYLGSFKREVDAARAYDEAARRFYGLIARCNFSVLDRWI